SARNLDVLRNRAGMIEQRTIAVAQQMNFRAWQAGAFQADDVEAAQFGAVAHGDGEGNDISNHGRTAANERIVADAHELMHGGQTADVDVVADLAMATERRAVGE